MILHVISGLGVGGAEAMLLQLATALHNAGLPQHVVSLSAGGENAALLRANGIAVTELGIARALSAPRALFELRRLIASHRPPVVQGWMYHGNIAAALAHRLAPGSADRRLFWGLRASDMDTVRYARINRVSAWLSGWPDVVIANSAAGARFHTGLGYRPRALSIIPNGIDVNRFCPDSESRLAIREELGIPPDAVVAIHVARVDAMKDHATFLAAMDRVPHVFGVLVGLGTDKLTLPANVRALGLRRDVPRLYAAADLVVSSSAFGEGFSNALAEGMSSGLIPVATDVGDARIIVGDVGRVVEPCNPDALVEAIASEAQRFPADRNVQGLKARHHMHSNFSIEKMVAAHRGLYEPAGVAASPSIALV